MQRATYTHDATCNVHLSYSAQVHLSPPASPWAPWGLCCGHALSDGACARCVRVGECSGWLGARAILAPQWTRRRAGYHAAWGAVPRGVLYRVGYNAARHTLCAARLQQWLSFFRAMDQLPNAAAATLLMVNARTLRRAYPRTAPHLTADAGHGLLLLHLRLLPRRPTCILCCSGRGLSLSRKPS